MATPGVITIGGHKYAANLYWQLSTEKATVKAAQKAAEETGLRGALYAERKVGNLTQFGLGEKKVKHKVGMPSAAASLANQHPGSWAGVFRIPEGLWLIVVRDDLIDTEGDKLFIGENSEAEAMARLDEEIARGGLQKIYAPAVWAIPGADDTALQLLMNARREGRLRAAHLPVGAIVKVAGVILGAILVFLMGWELLKPGVTSTFIDVATPDPTEVKPRPQFNDVEEDIDPKEILPEFDESLDIVAEINRDVRITSQQVSFQWPPPRRVWQDQMSVSDFFDNCREMMSEMEGVVMGWKMRSLSCIPNPIRASSPNPESLSVRISVMWGRERGGPALVPAGGFPDIRGQSATTSSTRIDVKARGKEPLLAQNTLTEIYLKENWPASLNRTSDDPPYIPPDLPPEMRERGERPPRPPWVKRSASFQVEGAPWALEGVISKIPGFVVNGLYWQGGAKWKLEGVIYELR